MFSCTQSADTAATWKNLHPFAHDSRLHSNLKSETVLCAIPMLAECIYDSRTWMASNFQQLKADKTDAMWVSIFGKLEMMNKVGVAITTRSPMIQPATSSWLHWYRFDTRPVARANCVRSFCMLFLPVEAAALHQRLSWQGVSCQTRTHFSDQPSGLLQKLVHQFTLDKDAWNAASFKRRQYTPVWPTT
jgi:hypothetical protein